MTTWKFIFLWILPFYVATDGVFECGEHGRFEYCIDGIPGCVIGCHCHPGYYFDTETKICEPNTKLTQNYRRRYVPEPTRIQNPYLLDVTEISTSPPVTTHNAINEHVNDITKNADDLGDWLYNQFFKTIENQVINNTDDNNLLTRRKGRASLKKENNLKGRTRTRSRNKHKKKKKSRSQKLLKIAEDDSLFQSSDSSESDDDTSSDDNSHSSSESDSNEDHGHRKIIMIKKKPKPPLPSFIFLPHMNTPYYPPIGLPPPPVMPMYPFVPVPPVMPVPPMMPEPPMEPCTDTITTSTTASTTITSSTTVKTVTKQNKVTEKVSSTIAPEVSSEEPPEVSSEMPTYKALARGHRGKKRGKIKSQDKNSNEEYPIYYNFRPERKGQQKLLQQLRQGINHPSFKKTNYLYNNNYMAPAAPTENNDMDDMKYKEEKSPLEKLEEMYGQQNVDFKYLSELIHRTNKTHADKAPLDFYRPPQTLEKFKTRERPSNKYNDFIVPIGSRRDMNTRITSRDGQSDDLFYSNLGRQIATLIRTIDDDNERKFDIKIEKVQQKPDVQTFFNENAPRTFWERYVRSPLKYAYLLKNSFDYLKNSNEVLYNIENKVATVATTARSLSLPEIENMVNVMETAQAQLRSLGKVKRVNPSPKTLNINLWPQEIKQLTNSIKSFSRQNVSNVNGRKFFKHLNKTRPAILNTDLNDINLQNPYGFSAHVNNLIFDLKEDSKHGLKMQPILKSTSTKLYVINNRSEGIYPKHKNELYEHRYMNNQYSINPNTDGNIKKYFFDDSNHYSFQNDNNLLLQYSSANTFPKPQQNNIISSPYFLHEISHIDYKAK